MPCRGRSLWKSWLVTGLVLAFAIFIFFTLQILMPCRCANDYHRKTPFADIIVEQSVSAQMKRDIFKGFEPRADVTPGDRSVSPIKDYSPKKEEKEKTVLKNLQPQDYDGLYTSKESENFGNKNVIENLSLAEISHMTWGQGLDVDAFLAWAKSHVTSNDSDSLTLPELQLRAETACTSDTELLVLMPSIPELMLTREIVRQTWARPAYKLSWPRKRVRLKTSLVFVLGVEGLDKSKINALEDESRDYDDLVTASFLDSYRNLTLKMLTGLNWVTNYCPSASYILKCDLDTFVNLPLLTQMLVAVSEKLPRFVLGGRHEHLNPPVLRSGKWSISYEDYPFPVFPPHVMGHSYILTAGLAPQMVKLGRRLPVVPSEDSFLTGVLASILKATRLHHDAFANNFKRLLPCNIVFNEDVTMTKMGMAHLLLMWRHVLTNKCSARELQSRANMVAQPGKKKQQTQQMKQELLQKHQQQMLQQQIEETEQGEWQNPWQNLDSNKHQPQQYQLSKSLQEVQKLQHLGFEQEQRQNIKKEWINPWQKGHYKQQQQQQQQQNIGRQSQQLLQQETQINHQYGRQEHSKGKYNEIQNSSKRQREQHLREEEIEILKQLR